MEAPTNINAIAALIFLGMVRMTESEMNKPKEEKITKITLPDAKWPNPKDNTFVSVAQFEKLAEKLDKLTTVMMHMDTEMLALKSILLAAEVFTFEDYEKILQKARIEMHEIIKGKNGTE